MSNDPMPFDEPTVFVVGNAKQTRQSVIDAGGEEGRHNRPASGDTEPDQNEKAIINTYQTNLSNLVNAAAHTLQQLRDRAREEHVKVPNDVDIVNIVDDELPKDVDKELEHVGTDLKRRLVDERDAGRGLRLFQLQYQLHGRARYPDSLWRHFSLVVLIMILESFFNMFFFAQGSDLGLLGGFFQAVMVSLVNVGSAVTIGHFCLPHMNVRGRKPVIIGLTALYVVFLLVFNLTVAHYRDLLAVTADSTAQQSVTRLLSHPFELSFHSLLLFVIGLLAAGFGLYKGYTADDPYPGYSQVDKRYRSTEAEVGRFQKELTGKIQDRCGRVESEIDQVMRAGEAAVQAISQLLTQARSVKETADAERERGLGKFRQFLKAYRDANTFVRDASNPPPAYFSRYDELDGIVLDASPLTEIAKHLSGASAALEGAQARATTERVQDQKRYERETNKLREKIAAIRKEEPPDGLPGQGATATT